MFRRVSSGWLCVLVLEFLPRVFRVRFKVDRSLQPLSVVSRWAGRRVLLPSLKKRGGKY